ncbi:MAG TPA: hypothetical protein VFZ16_07895 [Hyphomicrobiaceae bacterium]|nr:hypothetical protein [Hyphomicrobiaceae bacterium]
MCDVPSFFGDAVLTRTESELYQPLVDFLHSDFYTAQRPKHGNLRIVAQVVADVPAPAGGTWTRPDVAAVAVSRRKFAPIAHIDILSFEVKTHTGANLVSVYEALAHARFVNLSYLVWNRPACICGDHPRYQGIKDACQSHGVGLITVHNPSDRRTYDVRAAPTRSSVSDDALDDFVISRFSERNQALITNALTDFCPRPL